MAQFQRHLFVCINEREPGDPRGCCAGRGGVEVASAFKKKLYDRGLKRIVRPNKAMCLDQCARGTVVVIYPEGVWYGGVTVEDVDEIIDEQEQFDEFVDAWQNRASRAERRLLITMIVIVSALGIGGAIEL